MGMDALAPLGQRAPYEHLLRGSAPALGDGYNRAGKAAAAVTVLSGQTAHDFVVNLEIRFGGVQKPNARRNQESATKFSYLLGTLHKT